MRKDHRGIPGIQWNWVYWFTGINKTIYQRVGLCLVIQNKGVISVHGSTWVCCFNEHEAAPCAEVSISSALQSVTLNLRCMWSLYLETVYLDKARQLSCELRMLFCVKIVSVFQARKGILRDWYNFKWQVFPLLDYFGEQIFSVCKAGAVTCGGHFTAETCGALPVPCRMVELTLESENIFFSFANRAFASQGCLEERDRTKKSPDGLAVCSCYFSFINLIKKPWVPTICHATCKALGYHWWMKTKELCVRILQGDWEKIHINREL